MLHIEVRTFGTLLFSMNHHLEITTFLRIDTIFHTRCFTSNQLTASLHRHPSGHCFINSNVIEALLVSGLAVEPDYKEACFVITRRQKNGKKVRLSIQLIAKSIC